MHGRSVAFPRHSKQQESASTELTSNQMIMGTCHLLFPSGLGGFPLSNPHVNGNAWQVASFQNVWERVTQEFSDACLIVERAMSWQSNFAKDSLSYDYTVPVRFVFMLFEIGSRV